MDKELELYFSAYFELFRTSGWKQLVETLNADMLQINDISGTRDNEDLFFRKGQLSVISTLLTLEQRTEDTHRQLSEEEAET
jgi:hypothetical protein